MNQRILGAFTALSLLVLGSGCSSGRDVDVKGEIETASGVPEDAPIRLDVYESSEDEEEALVDSFVLDGPGTFEETLAVEGDTLRFVALVDANGNEKCDAGEAWGEGTVEIADDDTATFAVRITAQTACPVAPAAETEAAE
jgi:hypothetical protein